MNIRKTGFILTIIAGLGFGFSSPSQARDRGHSSSVTFVSDGAIIRLGDRYNRRGRDYCPPRFYRYRDNHYGYYDRHYNRHNDHHYDNRRYRYRKNLKKQIRKEARRHYRNFRRHHNDHH